MNGALSVFFSRNGNWNWN